jgi:uncharacterized protein (DUF1015 family)
MSMVRPFRAWLPPASSAAEIASVPYDVIDSAEARVLADGKPRSFLHVIRPEIDLDPGVDLHGDAVYAKAAENLGRWLDEVPYTESPPSLFVYRLVWRGRAQVGVVGACSVDEYDAGGIAIHERTRPDKEDDRTRHVVTMRCQAEPIFLAYRAEPAISALVEATMRSAPRFDFVAEDGVQHTLWDVADPGAMSAAFEAVPRLYVADGHHRAKSASRARETLRAANPSHTGTEPYNYVLSVVFPDDQLAILPYNRLVTDLGALTPEDALARIGEIAPLRTASSASPEEPGTVCVYAAGRWYAMELVPAGDAVIDQLDVTLLQERVLAPVFGIEDPRRDARIEFVGGIRGTEELARRADAHGGVAFSMVATSLAQLFDVADSGGIMPPKSTWFEPKLRSGLFVHRI